MKLAEGREDFHTLVWLAYANLMLGKFDEAKKNVELARAAAERNPANAGIRDGYLGMRGRYLLETEQWEKIALDGTDAHAGDHDAMPGMPHGQRGAGAWLFFAGVSAAKRGDAELAERFAADLGKLARAGCRDERVRRERRRDSGETGRGAREGRARRPRTRRSRSRKKLPTSSSRPQRPRDRPTDEACVRALRRAAARGESRRPTPWRAFEQALLRTPRRTPSLAGLGAAAAAAGDAASRAAPTRSWRRCPVPRLTLPQWSPRNAGSPPIRTEIALPVGAQYSPPAQ